MKALQVIESAYRCTIEEQDDPAIWISHAMNKADADIGILLRANAVNYATRDQDASGLTFGDMNHAHPPSIDTEITRFIKNKVPVYLVQEDLSERGIQPDELLPGIKTVPRSELPGILANYDQIWHW